MSEHVVSSVAKNVKVPNYFYNFTLLFPFLKSGVKTAICACTAALHEILESLATCTKEQHQTIILSFSRQMTRCSGQAMWAGQVQHSSSCLFEACLCQGMYVQVLTCPLSMKSTLFYAFCMLCDLGVCLDRSSFLLYYS